MTTSVTSINGASTQTRVENEASKKEKATITFQEWWSGEKSLTSTAARRVGWENLADWLEDKDKVCTDGQDDGKLGFKEGAKAWAKGFFGGIPKAMINHPLITGGVLALAAGATVLTGGAAAPILWGLGAAAVVGGATASIVKSVTADTDAEKKAALEGVGTSTAAAAMLGATYNTTMTAAKQAGVNTDGNIVQTMKSSAEVSTKNIKSNITYLKSGVVNGEASLAHRGEDAYISKPNDVDAYRFNPNGTPEEILANNPHVEQVNGRYGVVDKWATGDLAKAMKGGMTQEQAIEALNLSPAKVANGKVYHLIDPSKDPMIMMYGPGDCAVCDGGVFKGSYVDQTAFKANGSLNYQDPTKLVYGEVVQVTKQAPGSFKVYPAGTQVQTVSEGVQTVQTGQVVAFDHAGNPYVTPAANILKRNTGLSEDAIQVLNEIVAQTK